jgi:hypothetical protein
MLRRAVQSLTSLHPQREWICWRTKSCKSQLQITFSLPAHVANNNAKVHPKAHTEVRHAARSIEPTQCRSRQAPCSLALVRVGQTRGAGIALEGRGYRRGWNEGRERRVRRPIRWQGSEDGGDGWREDRVVRKRASSHGMEARAAVGGLRGGGWGSSSLADPDRPEPGSRKGRKGGGGRPGEECREGEGTSTAADSSQAAARPPKRGFRSGRFPSPARRLSGFFRPASSLLPARTGLRAAVTGCTNRAVPPTGVRARWT